MVIMVAGFLIFLAMNFLVIFNSYLILKNFKIGNPEDKFLALGVVTVSQIILILLFLGLIKILYLVNVVLLSCLLTTILVFFNLLKTRQLFVNDLILDLKGSIRAIKTETKQLKKLGFTIRLSLLVLIFTLFTIVFYGLTTPPYSDDGLSYHLPMAVSWLKSGAIYTVEITTFTDVNVAMYYPGNSELILLWNLLPFHDDIIVDISQLAFAIMGAIACYGIARKIKIKKKNALWASILFLLTPVIILQSKTTYNDVIFASMFLISINFLLAYRKTNKKFYIILSSLSFGFVLGTKYLGILYFLAYILFFILAYHKKRLSKTMIYDLIIVALFVSLMGGFWYIKNFLEDGSIIYPMKVNLFGYKIMDAPHDPRTIYIWLRGKYVSTDWEWLIYPFLDGHRTQIEYSYETGFGPQFISLIVPSIIFIFIFFFVKKREIFFLLFPMLMFLFVITPAKEPRYYISIIGIGSVAFSYCISKMSNSKIIKIVALFCIFFSVYNSLSTIYSCNKSILKIQKRYDIWSCNHPSYAEGWKWLDDHTNGDNIVAVTHLLYPLYGDKLKNKIVYIDSDFYDKWVKLLKEYEIKYLFMAPFDNYEYTIREYDFIQKLELKPVYETEKVSIYSIENL